MPASPRKDIEDNSTVQVTIAWMSFYRKQYEGSGEPTARKDALERLWIAGAT